MAQQRLLWYQQHPQQKTFGLASQQAEMLLRHPSRHLPNIMVSQKVVCTKYRKICIEINVLNRFYNIYSVSSSIYMYLLYNLLYMRIYKVVTRTDPVLHGGQARFGFQLTKLKQLLGCTGGSLSNEGTLEEQHDAVQVLPNFMACWLKQEW